MDLDLLKWADKIKEEIDADSEHQWYKPNSEGIFDQAWMKFINRNLNNFHFPNMVALAYHNEHEFNPNYVEALKFCEYSRQFNNDTGPFGRMCVWRIPPGKQLLPHVDDFEYHAHIVRNIFIVSDNVNGLFKVNITKIRSKKESINCPKGAWFQFHPHEDFHEFINNTDKDFYFLGYDYWYSDKLNSAVDKIGKDKLVIREDQRYYFGAVGTDKLYITQH